MAPRNTLTQHQKIHIRRQFSARSVTCARSLAEHFGISKAALGTILEEENDLSTQSSSATPHVTIDFIKKSFCKLEVKETILSPKKELGRNCTVKEEDSHQEKNDEGYLEVTKESISSERKEDLTRTEDNTKASEEEFLLLQGVAAVSLNDNPAPYILVSAGVGEVSGTNGLSRRELAGTILTLRQLVESCREIPRWFTFTFNNLFPSYCYIGEDAIAKERCEWRCTASPPSCQDTLSALQVLCEALRTGHDLPAWFVFAFSRVLQQYRSRKESCVLQSLGLRKGQKSQSTSFFTRTF